MMEDENLNKPNPEPNDFLTNYAAKQDKPRVGMKVAGYNLLIFVAYTACCLSFSAGFIFDAVLLFSHVVVCLIFAIDKRSWVWLLSGLLILIIGFSTCVTWAEMGH